MFHSSHNRLRPRSINVNMNCKMQNGNCSIKFDSWVSHFTFTSVYLLYLYLICCFFLILYSYPLFCQSIPYPLFFHNLSLIPYNFIHPLFLIFSVFIHYPLYFLEFIPYPLRPLPPLRWFECFWVVKVGTYLSACMPVY